MKGLVLDAGALIAVDRGGQKIQTLLKTAKQHKFTAFVPANVVTQAWGDGTKQALLAKFLKEPWVRVVPVDEALARAAGLLLGKSGGSDAVDASVVVTAVKFGVTRIVTSDPGDIAKLGPNLDLIVI